MQVIALCHCFANGFLMNCNYNKLNYWHNETRRTCTQILFIDGNQPKNKKRNEKTENNKNNNFKNMKKSYYCDEEKIFSCNGILLHFVPFYEFMYISDNDTMPNESKYIIKINCAAKNISTQYISSWSNRIHVWNILNNNASRWRDENENTQKHSPSVNIQFMDRI